MWPVSVSLIAAAVRIGLVTEARRQVKPARGREHAQGRSGDDQRRVGVVRYNIILVDPAEENILAQ